MARNGPNPAAMTSQPLTCRYVNIHSSNNNMTADTRQQLASRADALLYNLCPSEPRPEGARPDTPVVSVSMESPGNYDCLNQPAVMRKADIAMSYQTCAQVNDWAASPALDCFSISSYSL